MATVIKNPKNPTKEELVELKQRIKKMPHRNASTLWENEMAYGWPGVSKNDA